jgi:hypothetical protein
MTVFQMVKHCALWEDMVLHGEEYRRVFVGWLFGKIALIEEHGRRFNAGFVHPFFGRMTQEETGVLAYKHSDHHLRQFGC